MKKLESYQKPITVSDLHKLLKEWTQSGKGGYVEVVENTASYTVVSDSAAVTEEGLSVVFFADEHEDLFKWEAIKENTLFFDERDSTFHCKAKLGSHNVNLRILVYPYPRPAGWARLRLFAKIAAGLNLTE